jgi:hypothetical protein
VTPAKPTGTCGFSSSSPAVGRAAVTLLEELERCGHDAVIFTKIITDFREGLSAALPAAPA